MLVSLFIDDAFDRYKAILQQKPELAVEIVPIFSASGLKRILETEFQFHAISLDYDMPGTGLVYPQLLTTLAFAIKEHHPKIIIHSSRRSYDKFQPEDYYIQELIEQIQDMFDIQPVRCRYSDEREQEWARQWISLL